MFFDYRFCMTNAKNAHRHHYIVRMTTGDKSVQNLNKRILTSGKRDTNSLEQFNPALSPYISKFSRVLNKKRKEHR